MLYHSAPHATWFMERYYYPVLQMHVIGSEWLAQDSMQNLTHVRNSHLHRVLTQASVARAAVSAAEALSMTEPSTDVRQAL